MIGRNLEAIMFIGEYIHSVDEKKRLSVPAKFRKELGKKAVITLGLNKCLSLYPTKEWNVFAEKLSKLSMGKSEDRGFSRTMLSGAFEVEVDSIGRIVIPEALKTYAGLREKVVLTGVYDRVEVWDEEAWKSYKLQMVAETDRMAEQLGDRGVF
jgi:MraZ protein